MISRSNFSTLPTNYFFDILLNKVITGMRSASRKALRAMEKIRFIQDA